jgi:HK97 family phage major capsid protein/HK97 family phage prohead protease
MPAKITSKVLKTGVLYRTAAIDRTAIDEENRTVNLSFSSEEPYPRWFGIEILDHKKKSVDMSFIGTGRAPFLVGHWTSDVVGVVESARIGTDRKGRAVVRFGKSRLAKEIFQDVLDGIRSNISVGYHARRMVLEKDDEDEGKTYRVTDWKPLEVSIVAIPADETVGIGRKRQQSQQSQQREYDHLETMVEEKGGIMPGGKEVKPVEQKAPPAPVVDTARIEADTRANESARVRDIIALGDMHNLRDEAMQAIKKGKSLDQFRAFVLDSLTKKGLKPVEQKSGDIGMTDRETKEFSFVRALNAMAHPNDAAAQRAAAFEFEASAAVAGLFKRQPQGLFIPPEVLRRDLTVGTDTAGGYLVATDLLAANFIELLRNKMMLKALGAITLGGLVGDVAIPKQTGGATAYWVAESGAPTESDQTVGQLALTPKTVGAFTDISRKLLKQASMDVEAFVRADLAGVLALAIDLAGISGTGADNQPTGILNTTGIGAVVCGDPDGAAPVWADIVGLETEVAIDNADVGALAYLSNAKVRGKLKQTEKASNTAQFVWEKGLEAGFGEMNGYRAAVSNQVPSDLTKGAGTALSAILFGNFADLILAMWGTLDILVDPYTGSTAGTVRVVALQDADIGVRNPESFAAAQDAVTT